MTTTMHERDILALPMGSNDADAETIGQFIMLIGAEVFTEQEDFSGKRPFGNSGWIFGYMKLSSQVKSLMALWMKTAILKNMITMQAMPSLHASLTI